MQGRLCRFAVVVVAVVFQTVACGSSVPTAPAPVVSLAPVSPPVVSPEPSGPAPPASPSVPVPITYEMTGVVSDNDGIPIPSAVVWATVGDFDQAPPVYADGAGRYSVRFVSFPGKIYAAGYDPPGASQAVVIATADAPGYDPYSAFVSAPAEQFSRNLRLHRQRRIAVGEAAVLNVLPEDSICVVDAWPGREMVCRRVHIIPSTDGLLTVTAAPTDGGEPARFFEAWRLDGRGGQSTNPASLRVAAGSEVIVAVGVRSGQVASRSFLITTAVTP